MNNSTHVKVKNGQPTTFYVVAYDIPDDKRRTKVHKLLKGFGEWTEYSLFECFLTKKEVVLLRERLNRLLKPTEDKVRIYMLCQACLPKIETIGLPEPEEKTVYLL